MYPHTSFEIDSLLLAVMLLSMSIPSNPTLYLAAPTNVPTTLDLLTSMLNIPVIIDTNEWEYVGEQVHVRTWFSIIANDIALETWSKLGEFDVSRHEPVRDWVNTQRISKEINQRFFGAHYMRVWTKITEGFPLVNKRLTGSRNQLSAYSFNIAAIAGTKSCVGVDIHLKSNPIDSIEGIQSSLILLLKQYQIRFLPLELAQMCSGYLAGWGKVWDPVY